jgi:hypothetical protein
MISKDLAERIQEQTRLVLTDSQTTNTIDYGIREPKIGKNDCARKNRQNANAY